MITMVNNLGHNKSCDCEHRYNVDNFICGKFPRIAKIVGESTVTPKDDDIIVSGLSIENVSQTAANIESCTKIKDKDLRVFLDGVYIYEKGKGQN